MQRTAISRHRLVWAVPLLLVMLEACGRDGRSSSAEVASLSTGSTTSVSPDPSASTPPEDPQEAALEFARCMREHGVDMPDPQFEQGGARGEVSIGISGDSGAFEEAQEECGGLLGSAAESFTPPDPEEQARFQEAMLDFAACMREHGIDFPDPQMSGGMVQIGGEGVDPRDPDFKAADEACRDKLPGLEGPTVQAGGGKADG